MEANCSMKMWHIVGDLRSKLSQGFFILKETPCGILHTLPPTHTDTHSPLSPSVVSNGCLQEGRNSLLRSVLLSDLVEGKQMSVVTGRSPAEKKLSETNRKTGRGGGRERAAVTWTESETGGEAREEITYVKQKFNLNGECSLRRL